MSKKLWGLTSLILNDQLQLLKVLAICIACSTSESEVGREARVGNINVSRCVARARGGVRSSSKDEWRGFMRVGCCESNARARSERKDEFDKHVAPRLEVEAVQAVEDEKAFKASASSLYKVCASSGAGYKWVIVTMP